MPGGQFGGQTNRLDGSLWLTSPHLNAKFGGPEGIPTPDLLNAVERVF